MRQGLHKGKVLLILFCGFVVLALCACTSLSVDIPAPEVRLPEVAGRSFAGSAGVGLVPASRVTVTRSANTRPPQVGDPETKASAEIPILADIGLWRRAQIGVQLGPVGSAAIANGTVQILGEPAETTQVGNMPLSIYGRYGSASGYASGDQGVIFGPSGFPWRAKARVRISGVGASFGYRPVERVLLYTGYAIDWYRADAEIVQAPSSDGTSAGGTYRFKQGGRAETAAVGVCWGIRNTFTLQVLYHDLDWTNTGRLSQLTGAAIGRVGW